MRKMSVHRRSAAASTGPARRSLTSRPSNVEAASNSGGRVGDAKARLPRLGGPPDVLAAIGGLAASPDASTTTPSPKSMSNGFSDFSGNSGTPMSPNASEASSSPQSTSVGIWAKSSSSAAAMVPPVSQVAPRVVRPGSSHGHGREGGPSCPSKLPHQACSGKASHQVCMSATSPSTGSTGLATARRRPRPAELADILDESPRGVPPARLTPMTSSGVASLVAHAVLTSTPAACGSPSKARRLVPPVRPSEVVEQSLQELPRTSLVPPTSAGLRASPDLTTTAPSSTKSIMSPGAPHRRLTSDDLAQEYACLRTKNAARARRLLLGRARQQQGKGDEDGGWEEPAQASDIDGPRRRSRKRSEILPTSSSSYSEEREGATSCALQTSTADWSSSDRMEMERSVRGHGSVHVLAAFTNSASRVQHKLNKLDDLRHLLSVPPEFLHASADRQCQSPSMAV